eukprot:RCo050766
MRIAILAALPRFCMGPSPSENVPVTIPRALYFCLVMALSLGKGKSFSSQKGSRKGSLLCLRVSASLTALGSWCCCFASLSVCLPVSLEIGSRVFHAASAVSQFMLLVTNRSSVSFYLQKK